MEIADKYPQGYWETNGKKFINKFEALVEATKSKTDVYYKFFNHIWENFDTKNCGKHSLNNLYKLRAQQLRDKYDYLILYFSGGADSYNVLCSFINNNILLDEICIKWPKAVFKNNIYEPGLHNSSFNYLSEWDYAIKPVLDQIKISHPNILITIVDWFEDHTSITDPNNFRMVNHWHDVEITSLAVWSPTEQKLVEKGKKVGSIYGIDKPKIWFDDFQNAYMFFIDSAVTMGTPNPINPFGCEYFYWTADMPELSVESAMIAAKYIVSQKDIYERLSFNNQKRSKNFWLMMEARQAQETELRHVLYTTWTNRFQAKKPIYYDRRDKCWWIFSTKELAYFKDGYKDTFNLHINQVDQKFLGDMDPIYRAMPTNLKLLFKKDEL